MVLILIEHIMPGRFKTKGASSNMALTMISLAPVGPSVGVDALG